MKLQNSPGSLVKTERPSLAIMLQYRSGAFDIWPHSNFVTFGLSNCRVIIMHVCLSMSCILGNFVRCAPWHLFLKVHNSVHIRRLFDDTFNRTLYIYVRWNRSPKNLLQIEILLNKDLIMLLCISQYFLSCGQVMFFNGCHPVVWHNKSMYRYLSQYTTIIA